MKLNPKMMLPALALPLLLAACGTASTGAGTIKFNELKTEYKDANGNYVACDNVTGGTGNAQQTAVGVYYTATGSFDNLQIGLNGSKDNTYDSYYIANVDKNKLNNITGNDYKTVFFADSSKGYLPLAIVVNPNPNVAIKKVTTSELLGSFYAKLTINGNGVSASTTSKGVSPSVNVYSSCAVTSTTQDKL